ncbi:MAG: carbon monoxide dehydrogenase [Rhodospirillaceae bacterium]|nr:carbon monoxide dehydrogenase [Rhodospirillaceae bacterium]|tara:strand:+ start:660 stop:1454 length:795 start_codon:yes stop_codon:yes gene_type:complete
MYDFSYKRPTSLSDAAEMSEQAEDGSFLAGGMTLIPALKLRLASPSILIDLGGVQDLTGISQENNTLTVRAMTKHADVAVSSEVKNAIPALSEVAESIGDPQVRNRGTIGGSISNADPAADYPAALLGLGATVETNSRTIGSDDFFTGLFGTALNANELVVAVHFPIPKRAVYMKFPNPASRYAIVGVMVAECSDEIRVAVTGAGPSVFRVFEMEEALQKNFSPNSIQDMIVSADGLNEDMHASADYRAHLITVMAKRAVAKLI